jgi:TolA-binding protein
LDSIERQMADLVRASEENGNRLSTMEAELARLRADQDQRLRALENATPATPPGDGPAAAQPADVPEDNAAPPPRSKPKVERGHSEPAAATTAASADSAEAAYNDGYQLWNAGKYDAAIASLRKFVAAYPGNRRVSWANNLIGRALLDKGQYRPAAEALLANYRTDKDGERAPDSLYYLGQASMKLGQPAQACKAYAELENVYGTTMRPALRQLLTPAKAEAKCR